VFPQVTALQTSRKAGQAIKRTKAELERLLQESQEREKRLLLSRMRVFWKRIDGKCMKIDALLDLTLEQFIFMHKFSGDEEIELGNGVYLHFQTGYQPRMEQE
jgi:hypothetical protein